MVFVFYVKFSKLTFLNLYFFHPRNKRKLLEFQSWVATVKLFFMKKLVHCSIPFRNCILNVVFLFCQRKFSKATDGTF